MSEQPGGPDPGPAGPRPRLVLTGGGTGGHLYPAISLARASQAGCRGKGAACRESSDAGTLHPTPFPLHPVFIGSRDGLEARVVPQAGFEFYAVSGRKLSRTLSVGTVRSLASIVWGSIEAGRLLRKLAPAAVIGTGGYASAGVVLAAAMQRIPTLIHEQNSVPGRTNRLLARFARRVALTFPESAQYFPAGKSRLTGLPVRPEIGAGDRRRAACEFDLDPEKRTLLVLGGSLGARSLNAAVRRSLPLWLNSGVQILHQVGRGNWEEHQAALPESPAGYHAVPYLEAMGDAYAAADLACCRAGASTMAELTLVGLPAVLVPYPHAHADHQTHNARSLVSAGAAVLLPDTELTGQRLGETVNALFEDPARLARMAAASQALGRPDAAAEILSLVAEIIDWGADRDSKRGAKRGAA